MTARLYRPDGTSYLPAFKAAVKPTHAPFDTVKGEVVGDLGNAYVVVSPTKWADTPVLDMAMARTKDAMKGYRLAPVQAEMLVQEYHAADQLAIVVAVWGKAPGKATWQWHYTTTVIEIKGRTKADMVLAGRWKAGTRH